MDKRYNQNKWVLKGSIKDFNRKLGVWQCNTLWITNDFGPKSLVQGEAMCRANANNSRAPEVPLKSIMEAVLEISRCKIETNLRNCWSDANFHTNFAPEIQTQLSMNRACRTVRISLLMVIREHWSGVLIQEVLPAFKSIIKPAENSITPIFIVAASISRGQFIRRSASSLK